MGLCEGILDCAKSFLEPVNVIWYRSLEGLSSCSYDICQIFSPITEGETTYEYSCTTGNSQSASWKLRGSVLSETAILLVP